MKLDEIRVEFYSSIYRFISHTVQMKQEDNFFQQSILRSLYPTRFRWNYILKTDTVKYSELYIPHGSDETKYDIIFYHPEAILYIPHGSDETTAGLLNILPCKRLYIPHGSDETRILKQTKGKWMLSFISHTVQMKHA